MWSRQLFGADLYQLVAAFVLYSMLGWLVESIYMSFCNRKLTNRGFARSPFCPIYGFGAVACFLIMGPMQGQYVKIYLMGAFLATVFEYLVGRAMIAIFGKLWWDYNDKPFNFQGIICLESTVAWGFYALGIVHFVHGWILQIINYVDVAVGIRAIQVILLIVSIDYVVQLLRAFHVDMREKRDEVVEVCKTFLARG